MAVGRPVSPVDEPVLPESLVAFTPLLKLEGDPSAQSEPGVDPSTQADRSLMPRRQRRAARARRFSSPNADCPLTSGVKWRLFVSG